MIRGSGRRNNDYFRLLAGVNKQKHYDRALEEYQKDALDAPLRKRHDPFGATHAGSTPSKLGFSERPDFFEEEKKKPHKPTPEYDVQRQTKHDREARKRKLWETLQNETEYNSRPLLDTDPRDEYKKIDESLAFFTGQHPFRSIYVGFSGSGKTTKLVYDIQNIYSKQFDEIHVFSPNINTDPAWKDAVNIQGYDKWDENKINEIRNKNRQRIKEGGRSQALKILMIVDDFAADKHVVRGGLTTELAIRCRHDGMSVIYVSQVYKKLDPTLRRNLSDFVIWKPHNNEELEIIAEDVTPGLLKPAEFIDMLQDVTSEKYSHLTVHNREEEHKKYWKNTVEPIDVTEYIHAHRLKRSPKFLAMVERHREKFDAFAYKHDLEEAEKGETTLPPEQETKVPETEVPETHVRKRQKLSSVSEEEEAKLR